MRLDDPRLRAVVLNDAVAAAVFMVAKKCKWTQKKFYKELAIAMCGAKAMVFATHLEHMQKCKGIYDGSGPRETDAR